MPITSNDIKLMQPERLTDNADGGGQMTGREVVDGDVNNLFSDISRVDRTYGETSMRKPFYKVDTPAADLLLDAHVILSAQPADPNVRGLLFSTGDYYDERSNARQRVESYVIPGPVTGLYLRGDQLQGQRALICYSPRVNNATPPEIGETFMLQTDDDPQTRQFVKALSVEQTQEVFTYQVSQGGDIRTFRAYQYVLELSAELKRDYPATDPSPRPEGPTYVYSTQPSSSARYYGTTTLANAATPGATSVQVAETFAPIIPTASNDTPLTDQRPGGFVSRVVPTGDTPLEIDVDATGGGVSTLPTAAVPGSLSITLNGVTYNDAGGEFASQGGAGELDGTVISYGTGTIAWQGINAGTQTLSYRPGVEREQVPNTGRIDIDETNSAFNYVLSLDPAPARRTLTISYQYLGKWYDIQDNGTGRLVGDGSGNVNYTTGSVVATLSAQPDAGSVLFYRWVVGGIYTLADDPYNATAPVELRLAHRDLVPGQLTLSWEEGSTAKTATDSAGDGTLTGDATGTVNYATGVIHLSSPGNPDDQYTAGYTYKPDTRGETLTTVPNNANQSDIVLQSAANIAPGTVRFTLVRSLKREIYNSTSQLIATRYRDATKTLFDNGNGYILEHQYYNAPTVGTVNYSTGEITVTGAAFLRKINENGEQITTRATEVVVATGAERANSWRYESTQETEEIRSHDVTVSYQLASAGTQTVTGEAFSGQGQPWQFPLSDVTPLLPGTAVLDIAGERLFDNGTGQLLRQYSPATGTGLAVGSINYETSAVEISPYSGRPNSATVTPVAAMVGDDWSVISEATFRTAAAPLRPNGFTVRADGFQYGNQYTGAADTQGTVTGDGITGNVDLQSGIAQITFPNPVMASSLFYNIVAFKRLPLDPDILGLDPVRLPADGRVPIIRDADILVLTHTASESVSNPTANQVLDAGRTNLYDAWVVDENGERLASDQYSLDKSAGQLTLADPFSAENDAGDPLTGALTFRHRVEDMALCADARIDGALNLAQPLTHHFPADETAVASAVYLGDLQARVRDWRSYQTDPGDYDSDGPPTTANYNQIAYPVAIENGGAVPERWKIVFTSPTAFELYGEQRGLVDTGSISVDFEPVNPQTGTPYFSITADGWGSGWATGNTVRFDTAAAAAPLWAIRTVLPGHAAVDDDQIKIELRGDHD